MSELQTRFTTEGLVIKEMQVGESDRLVTLFTKEYGILKAFAAGAKTIKSKKGAATALLTYSSFTIQRKKDTYRIYEATPITSFFTLGGDIEVVALSTYFCELAQNFAESGVPNNELLRLILNSLHFLNKEKRYPPLIKAITELRTAVLSGYSPNLVACDGCGKFEDDIMFLSLSDGRLFCNECERPQETVFVDRTCLSAMRHITFSQFEKLYAFEIPNDSAQKLSKITEKYLTLQSDCRFRSLEFYNSVINL
ncbi:MAG: DNA repair protein RecO [Ruminococcaceae bacterium]|nr:DNA repair protein RecO [Oscillospiraceae bacterium]